MVVVSGLVLLSCPPAMAAGASPGREAVPASVGDTVPAAPHLSWSPERPTQGTLLVLRVTPAPGTVLEAVSGRAGGETLHFYPADGGVLASLAPVPVDASGSVGAALTVRYASGSTDSIRASIPVRPGSYHHEELTVAPELGSPLSKENRARLAGDQAEARAVSRAAEQTGRLWTRRAVLPRDARITGGF
ncbi:MAG: hypothetical protein PVJ02_16140, partial [Gemmatimonadota bacterium]